MPDVEGARDVEQRLAAADGRCSDGSDDVFTLRGQRQLLGTGDSWKSRQPGTRDEYRAPCRAACAYLRIV